MPPKNERFELRLDEGLISRIDEWRFNQNDPPSRSETVRQLLESALASKKSKEIIIEPVERLLIGMMSEIMKNTSATRNPEYDVDFIMGSIYGGHFWALEWELDGLFHDSVVSHSNVTEVVDTLDMWAFIELAFARLTEADRERIEIEAPYRQVSFVGYDGNYETEHMTIVRHLVEKMNRYQQFKGREFNSHTRKRPYYCNMLQKFHPMRTALGPGRTLSVDELIELLSAQL